MCCSIALKRKGFFLPKGVFLPLASPWQQQQHELAHTPQERCFTLLQESSPVGERALPCSLLNSCSSQNEGQF